MKGRDRMTDTEWVTVSEASEKTHIPVETIRRYIRSHSVHLRVKKLGKKYHIHDESMTVLYRIRALYDQGKNIDEVEESLSASGIPMTITVQNDDESSMTVHVADELKDIKKELQEQRQLHEQQKQFNMQLLQEIKNQQLYYEKKFEETKYDREFVGSLRNSMEQRRIESSGHERMVNEQLENVNQQLSEIQQNNNVKELSEQVAELSNQVEQMVKKAQEPAATKEKKSFWSKLFGSSNKQ
jgi:DNA-binding transcriptional MerR regulator